jgi:hypothetical protein
MNLLLLESADGPAVLHVFDGGVCVRTAIGRAAALREVYVPAFYPGCEIEEVTSDQLAFGQLPPSSILNSLSSLAPAEAAAS